MFLTYAGGAWERKTTARDIVAFLLTGGARGDTVSSLNAWKLPGLGKAFIPKHIEPGGKCRRVCLHSLTTSKHANASYMPRNKGQGKVRLKNRRNTFDCGGVTSGVTDRI